MRSAAPPSTRACGSGSHPPRHTFDGDALRVPGGASAESGPRLGVDTGAATCVGTPPRGPACQSPRVPAIESPTIDGSATGADNGRVTSDNFHLGDYRPRVLDGQLGEALGAAGAVVIEGPRACGKTETARRAAASEIRMDTPDAHQAFAVDADLVLAGDTPRLIDEWQEVPDLWNLVRHAVDDRRAPGQFILTGSSVPRDDERRHSGAGRFIRLRMRPMSLMESGHSAATVSLARVLVGERVAAPDPGLRVGDLAERIVVGGWPGNLGLTPAQAALVNEGYLEDVCRVDVARVDGVRRDPAGVRALVTSLARNTACPASAERVAADAGADRAMKVETARAYLGALDRLLLTDDVPAWSPSLRSRTRLRASSVRHLADPSLAAAALGAGPDALLADLNLMGLLFESLVVRDLRILAGPLRGRIHHYRDALGLEADAVIELPGGDWAAFEVKLGSHSSVVDPAAAGLLRLRARVAGRAPVALVVVTGTGYSFARPDGVLQVAIGALAA